MTKKLTIFIFLLFMLLAVVGILLLNHKPLDIPNDDHYSRLDYKTIDAKSMPRISMESALDGCTRTCSGNKEKKEKCEVSCSCFLNQLAARMSKEELMIFFLSQGQGQPLVPKIQYDFDQAINACDPK